MATPEQNALLALQLFGAPADQFNRQNDARTNLLYKLTESQGQDALKQKMADELNQRYIQLENLRAQNSQALADKTATREDNRMLALQGMADTRANAATALGDTRAAAADLKALRNKIAEAYPTYVAAATKLKQEVRPITDFEESWAGLGDLQKEMIGLNELRLERDQTDIAALGKNRLTQAENDVVAAKSALDASQKPTPDIINFARSRAVEAAAQAIAMGGTTGAPKPNSTAAKAGLSALQSGSNDEEATKRLGSGIMSLFNSNYQTNLQAAPNFKGWMQGVTVAAQNHANAVKSLRSLEDNLWKAAGSSPPLTQLLIARPPLEQLQGVSTETLSPEERMRKIFGTPSPTGASPVAPTAAASPPGLFNRGISALYNMAPSIPGVQPVIGALGSTGRALSSLPENTVSLLELLAAQRQGTPDQALIGDPAGP